MVILAHSIGGATNWPPLLAKRMGYNVLRTVFEHAVADCLVRSVEWVGGMSAVYLSVEFTI
jgi:hypothetical protein